MRPLVSVIVPIYNAAPFLKDTLDSIIASTYRPIEIVMVDDGSQDKSLSIAQDYCANYPECIQHLPYPFDKLLWVSPEGLNCY